MQGESPELRLIGWKAVVACIMWPHLVHARGPLCLFTLLGGWSSPAWLAERGLGTERLVVVPLPSLEEASGEGVADGDAWLCGRGRVAGCWMAGWKVMPCSLVVAPRRAALVLLSASRKSAIVARPLRNFLCVSDQWARSWLAFFMVRPEEGWSMTYRFHARSKDEKFTPSTTRSPGRRLALPSAPVTMCTPTSRVKNIISLRPWIGRPGTYRSLDASHLVLGLSSK